MSLYPKKKKKKMTGEILTKDDMPFKEKGNIK